MMSEITYLIVRCSLECLESELDLISWWMSNPRVNTVRDYLTETASTGCSIVQSHVRYHGFRAEFEVLMKCRHMPLIRNSPKEIQAVFVPSGVVFCGTDQTYHVTSTALVTLPGDWGQQLFCGCHLLPVSDIAGDFYRRMWNWLVDQVKIRGALDCETVAWQCHTILRSSVSMPSVATVARIMNCCLAAERRSLQWTHPLVA